MKDYKILEIKKSVFEDNDREADELRKALKMQKTFLLNLMSSPGSGKTTTLKRTIDMLKDEMKWALWRRILILMWMQPPYRKLE